MVFKLKASAYFLALCDLMIREKIQIPGYNPISDMILMAMQNRK